eukprot:403332481
MEGSQSNSQSQNKVNQQQQNFDSDYYDEEDYQMSDTHQSQQTSAPYLTQLRTLEPPKIIENKTSILLSKTHDSSKGGSECSYCCGFRETYSGEKLEGLKSYKQGFSSMKMRYDDFEELLNKGYSRSGTYFYQRNFKNSCCETFQYRVDAMKFKPSDSQRKAVRKFHKYINYGSIHGKPPAKQQQEEQKQKLNKNLQNEKLQSLQEPEEEIIQSIHNFIKDIHLESQLLNQQQIDKLQQVKTNYNKKIKSISSNALHIIKLGKEQYDKILYIINSKFDGQSTGDYQIVKIENGFINFYKKLDKNLEKNPSQIDKSSLQEEFKVPVQKQIKPLKTKLIKEQKQNINGQNYQEQNYKPYPPNHYKHYCIEYDTTNDPPEDHIPVHNYTIEIKHALYTEEFFDLYFKYEKAIHKKDRDPDGLKRFLCNSPIYYPVRDAHMAFTESQIDYKTIDQLFRPENIDLGVYPGYGSYHMYHRIDGKLVAVNVIDILNEVFVSAYCIYDPDMSFLRLGVVTAIRELEYFRMIKERYNPNLKWYQLGEMVITCPKVNYKLNYKPGYVICPRTKELVPIEKCVDTINMIAKMSIDEKMQLPYIQLVEYRGEGPLENELLPAIFGKVLLSFPFVYENTKKLNISMLSQSGQELMKNALSEMLVHVGIKLFSQFMFELKYPPEDPNEKKKEEEKQNSQSHQDQQKDHQEKNQNSDQEMSSNNNDVEGGQQQQQQQQDQDMKDLSQEVDDISQINNSNRDTRDTM